MMISNIYKYAGKQLIMLSIILTACSSSDRNCNDPNALNHSSRAQTDEGCSYNESTKPPKLVTDLPKKVKETSGLALIDGELYTHNDRGNTNELFTIDRENGSVTAIIELSNGDNVDWEDLAQSDSHLYVGDMGNNDGDRNDLKIYRIDKSDLEGSGNRSVQHNGIIRFHYPEQTIFFLDDHNYDCEAIIYRSNYLYLFTKHRADNRTNLYRIPAEPDEEEYAAELLASFPAGGRITGADIRSDGRMVVLCGYNKSDDVFLWVLTDYENDQFFSGEKRRISLGAFSSIGQVEALVFRSNNELYISSEKVKKHDLPARLYRLTL
jgi:hypothetical protein